MLIKHDIVALLAFFFMTSATVAEFSIGAGAIYNESPYRGYNDNVHTVPLVSYESESFYFRQITLGYILPKSEGNEFSITASYMPLEFGPGDSDDHAMKKLDKRDATIMADTAWYHHERWGNVKVSAAADVLGNSNGWVGEVSLSRPMPVGKLTLAPPIGALYYGEKPDEYYYGISDNEPRRSDLLSYSPGDSQTPYVDLSVKYTLTTNLTLLASANYSTLPDDIKGSPMVDHDDSFTFTSGLTWHF